MSLLKSSQSNVLHADVATFSAPPRCSALPLIGPDLTNKTYVDAAIAAGGGGVTVETVTGTDPLTPDVNVSFISGTTHTLPAPGESMQLGKTKRIVNLNTNAATPLFTVQPQTVPNITNSATSQVVHVRGMFYDSVLQRMYVGGSFTELEGVANTRGIAYYNFTAPVGWFAMGTGLQFPSANSSIVCNILVKGSRVYVCGLFTSAGGVAGTANIAYFDLGTSTWNALGLSAAPNGQVLQMRVFPERPTDLFLFGDFTSVDGLQINRVARYVEDRAVQRYFPVGGPVGANNGVPAFAFDGYLQASGGLLHLYVGGNFPSVNASPAIANTGNLAVCQYTSPIGDTDTGAWYSAVDQSSQRTLNASVTFLQMYNNQLIALGTFNKYGSTSTSFANPTYLYNIAVVNPLVDTQVFTLSAFPASPPAVLSVSKLFVDAANRLWVTGFPNNQAGRLNNTSFTDPNANDQVQIGLSGPTYYDPVKQRWIPVVGGGSYTYAYASTPDPDVLWVGVEVIYDHFYAGTSFNGIQMDLSNVFQLDMSKISRVAAPMLETFVNRTEFAMAIQYQFVELMKLNNNRYLITGNSGSGTTTLSTGYSTNTALNVVRGSVVFY